MNKKAFQKLLIKCLRASTTGIRYLICQSVKNTSVPYFTVKNYENYILIVPIRRTESCFLPLVCSHYDTVRHVEEIEVVIEGGLIRNKKKAVLGGDDRAGVAIALAMIHDKVPAIYLFCDKEETGGFGSSEFLFHEQNIIKTVNCYIGLDRRNGNEIALYDYASEELNNIFISEGYREVSGSFTDVSHIAGEYPKATVNVSVGFHNEHTEKEYVQFEECYLSLERISRIIPTLTGRYFNDLQVSYRDYGYGFAYGNSFRLDYDYPLPRVIEEKKVDREVYGELIDRLCLDCEFYNPGTESCDFDFECLDNF